MTKRELESLQYLKIDIQNIKDRIEEVKNKPFKITQNIDDMPKGSSSNDKLTDNLIDIEQLESRLNYLEAKYNNLHKRILELADHIVNPRNREVFLMRFVNNMTYRDIKIHLGLTVSVSTIRKATNRFVKYLENIK